MKLKLLAFIYTALMLSGCQTLNVQIPSEHCSDGDSECQKIYASKFNTVVNRGDDKLKPVEFTGFLISIDKAEFAKYDSSTVINRRIVSKNKTNVIDFTSSENLASNALQYRIDEMLHDQGKNMFITSVSAYKTNNPIQFRITDDCKGHEFRLSQTYIDCSFQALDHFENQLSQELEHGVKNGAPYTHVILHSTGWNNRPSNSIKHYNTLSESLEPHLSADFKPLFIGLTWPAAWDIPYLSLNNKANDADEIGLTWVNFLMNKTIPSAIENTSSQGQPKFVAMGHSLGARMMATATSSARFVNDGNIPDRPALDHLILLQSAFSGRRLYTDPEENTSFSHFKYYDGIRANAKAIVVTASDEDKGVLLARWADKGVGHFSSGKAHRKTCKKVNAGVNPHWSGQFTCHFQKDGLRSEWANGLNDINDDRILLLRLNSDSDNKHIISEHNDVKDPDVVRVILELMNVIPPEG